MWNVLSGDLRNRDIFFDRDDPRTWESVSIKRKRAGSLNEASN